MAVLRVVQVLLVQAVLPVGLPAQAVDQDEEAAPRRIDAVRLEASERIRLDGRLDEPAWQRAAPATGFRQRDPVQGAPATEGTEVRILYDRNALYLGVTAHDSDPDGVIAHQRKRDGSLDTDDRFRWILDTFDDGRTGYFFEINPAGLMGDGLLRAGGSVNRAWDGLWEARVVRDESGWSAEVRIPFRTLNFNPSLDAWGINFQRTIRRKNEEVFWSGHRRNQSLLRPVHGGRLTGLEGLSQGVGLEATPFFTSSWRRESEESPGDAFWPKGTSRPTWPACSRSGIRARGSR